MEIIEDLKNSIYETIERNIEGIDKVGIVFSGDLDSSILAKICDDLGLDVTLLTVGFPESKDIHTIKIASQSLNLPCMIKLLEMEDIQKTIPEIISLTGNKKLPEIEINSAFYHLYSFAKENRIRNILTTTGTDALFCGFDKFKKIHENGEKNTQKAIEKEIEYAFSNQKEHKVIAEHFGINLIDPFLDLDFVDSALRIPIDQKIRGSDDDMRKHILREVGMKIRLPTYIVFKEIKSVQHSSGIHDSIDKLAKEAGFKRGKYKQAYVDSLVKI